MVSQHVFKSYYTVDGTSAARLHIAQGINNLWLFERENWILDIGPIYDWRSVAPLDNRTECQINVNARHSDPKSRQGHHNLTYPISSYLVLSQSPRFIFHSLPLTGIRSECRVFNCQPGPTVKWCRWLRPQYMQSAFTGSNRMNTLVFCYLKWLFICKMSCSDLFLKFFLVIITWLLSD